MDLNKLTKAQLISRVEDLEKQTLSYMVSNVTKEVELLFKDVQKTVAFVYEAGFNFATQLQTITIFK